MGAARPGQILCSAMVLGRRRLLEPRWRLTELGSLELTSASWGRRRSARRRGTPTATVDPRGSRCRPCSLDSGRIFVGRDPGELERLRAVVKRSLAGEPKMVLLGGEPGIGKTRLATELA